MQILCCSNYVNSNNFLNGFYVCSGIFVSLPYGAANFCARFEKYSGKLGVSHSFIRIFALLIYGLSGGIRLQKIVMMNYKEILENIYKDIQPYSKTGEQAG